MSPDEQRELYLREAAALRSHSMPHYMLNLTGRMALVAGSGLLFAGFILGRIL